MSTDIQQATRYHSLTELQLRKEQIRNALHKNQTDIGKKWKSLFEKPKMKSKKGFSLASLLNTGAGALDGFLLAWKLYKKFHK